MLKPARLIAACLRCRYGGIATISAVLLPAVVLVAAGAMQLQYVYSLQKQTQDVADSAALWGAQQLALTPSGAASRTQSWAQAQLQGLTSSSTVVITATALTQTSMKVAIDANTPSFFANMFPAGGFNTHAEATAQGSSQAPLCVLTTGTTSGQDIHLSNTSSIQSTCLVESDADMTVDPGASLVAGSAEAVTSAKGNITPAAATGAQNYPDPFGKLAISSSQSCSSITLAPVTIATTLSPGTYCYPITLNASQTLTLSSGTYYFGAPVNVQGSATLNISSGQYYFAQGLTVGGSGTVTGTDVVTVFSKGSNLNLSGSASFNLSGRQSGSLAGFVLIADRTYTGSFTIDSDNISKLTGTVYIPTAVLSIQGTQKGIQASDWTVIDALGLTMTNSPDLVINSNYSGSSVPVPAGVGSISGPNRLTS